MTTQKAQRRQRRTIANGVRSEIASMHLDASDVVLVKGSAMLTPIDQLEFAHSLARVIQDVSGCAHVVVVPPGIVVEQLAEEDLLKRGLVRVLPTIESGASGVNWDALEDEAHQLVRMAFQYAKESWPG